MFYFKLKDFPRLVKNEKLYFQEVTVQSETNFLKAESNPKTGICFKQAMTIFNYAFFMACLLYYIVFLLSVITNM